MRLCGAESTFASLSADSDFGITGFSDASIDSNKASTFVVSDFVAAAAAVRVSNELDLPGVFCCSGLTGVATPSFSFSRCFSIIARFQAGRLANCSSSLTCFCCSSVSFCFLRSIRACFHGGTDILVFVKQPRLRDRQKTNHLLSIGWSLSSDRLPVVLTRYYYQTK